MHCFLLNATPGDCKEIGWLKPHFVTENGELRLSIHAVLVETPSCRIIVDMWFATTNSAKMTPRACFAARFCVIWKRPRMGGNSPALMLGASGVVIGTRFHATHEAQARWRQKNASALRPATTRYAASCSS